MILETDISLCWANWNGHGRPSVKEKNAIKSAARQILRHQLDRLVVNFKDAPPEFLQEVRGEIAKALEALAEVEGGRA